LVTKELIVIKSSAYETNHSHQYGDKQSDKYLISKQSAIVEELLVHNSC